MDSKEKFALLVVSIIVVGYVAGVIGVNVGESNTQSEDNIEQVIPWYDKLVEYAESQGKTVDELVANWTAEDWWEWYKYEGNPKWGSTNITDTMLATDWVHLSNIGNITWGVDEDVQARFDATSGMLEWKGVVDNLSINNLALPASYIIEKRGAYYVAIDGSTELVEFNSTDASWVIQSAIDALPNTRDYMAKIVIKGDISLSTSITLEKELWLDLSQARIIPPSNDYAFKIIADVRGAIYDIVVEGPSGAGDGYGIFYIKNAYRVWIQHIHVDANLSCVISIDASNNIYISDFDLRGDSATGSVGIRIGGDNVNAIEIHDGRINFFEKGIEIGNNTSFNKESSILRVDLSQNTYGIYIVNARNALIKKCWFENVQYAIYIANTGSYVPDEIYIEQNFFSLTSSSYNIYVSSYCYDIYVRDNVLGSGSYYFSNFVKSHLHDLPIDGYRDKNSGSAEITGDGSTTSFTISHGLATTPSLVLITPTNQSMAEATWWVSAKSSTTFTITFASAPANGVRLSFDWYAEV